MSNSKKKETDKYLPCNPLISNLCRKFSRDVYYFINDLKKYWK